MKIICYVTSYWNTREECEARVEGLTLPWQVDPRSGAPNLTHAPCYAGRFGLRQWHANVSRWFSPVATMIACGTWSEPAWCPLPAVVVNAGVEPDRPTSPTWDYCLCAFSAAMSWLLNRRDWDLAIHLTDDCLVGAIDWDQLLRSFLRRDELVLATQWHGRDRMDWPIVIKRPAAVRLAHSIRPSLVEGVTRDLPEYELARLFTQSWWDPWCQLTTRYDHGWQPHPASEEELMKWPLIGLPPPNLIDRYLKENVALPVRPDPEPASLAAPCHWWRGED